MGFLWDTVKVPKKSVNGMMCIPGALLHHKHVAGRGTREEGGDGAENRVLDGREAARPADDKVGLDHVQHVVLQGLADAPRLHDDFDALDLRLRLGLGDLVGDGLAEVLLERGDEESITWPM